ncbi:hypothetical protein AVEN_95226-1 [Araneus ventricosus]|uniref:Uncharacterized protein n=1 Tax=Araneus ventricosus TaxID=182803 RepID=A0A4Y2DFN8_ARAVE|nr:hypothetical protein AVEN_95226-1 [Araneus ventricosus]
MLSINKLPGSSNVDTVYMSYSLWLKAQGHFLHRDMQQFSTRSNTLIGVKSFMCTNIHRDSVKRFELNNSSSLLTSCKTPERSFRVDFVVPRFVVTAVSTRNSETE